MRRIGALRAGVDKLVHPPETKKTFLDLAGAVDRIFRAIGVDERPEDLNDKRPNGDRLTEHLVVVLRVRGEVGMQLAG